MVSGKIDRIVLGTVQFGLAYGATNTTGQVQPAEVYRILEIAAREGITLLDTASTYGNSEAVIGSTLKQMGLERNFSAATKVFIRGTQGIRDQVFSQIEHSLAALQGVPIYAVMAHHGEQLQKYDELWAALMDAKQHFALPRLGASVYTTGEWRSLLKLPLELVQIPYNVFNQDFIHSPELKLARGQGQEIHARSVFLQGVLLVGRDQLNPWFQNYAASFDAYYSALADTGENALRFNLANALGQDLIDRLVIGVTSVKEFKDIVEAVKSVSEVKLPSLVELARSDEGLINPSKWNLV